MKKYMGSILIMAMILSGCSMGEDIGQFTGSNKLGGDITIGEMPFERCVSGGRKTDVKIRQGRDAAKEFRPEDEAQPGYGG